MDSARPARRPAALLGLVLAATTALSVAAPASAHPPAPPPPPLRDVVVTSSTASLVAVADAVRAVGGTVRDTLPLAGGVSADLPAGAVLPPAYAVVDNAPLSPASKRVAGGARAGTAVREALGVGAAGTQGSGVRIAVLDTGVADSPDLAGRLTHHDVSGTWTAGQPHDAYGHGTFVAGVAAGDGTSSQGRYAGAAPGAHVLDVRVADAQGETDLVTVLRGLEMAADLDADVVNLSMSSGSTLPYQVDPLTVALDRLWSQGVVVVVPTGNDGPGQGSITSPGTAPTLLTVGALDEQLTDGREDDAVPNFSGRGPAPQAVAKPDLVAPGQSLVSLRAPGSVVDKAYPDAVVDGGYFRGSGTSFATGVVSGAAAVLLQERPELAPDQVKGLVRDTAYTAKHLRDARDAGAGGLDLVAALQSPAPAVAPVPADPPPAGDVEQWHAFLQALLDEDRAAAARAWSQLSPAGHRWAGHRWAGIDPVGHRWAKDAWSGHRWAGADGTATEWQARFWAAHQWAAEHWTSDAFVGHRWAGSEWAADQVHAGEPAGHRWAGHRWAGHRWAGHRWAGLWD